MLPYEGRNGFDAIRQPCSPPLREIVLRIAAGGVPDGAITRPCRDSCRNLAQDERTRNMSIDPQALNTQMNSTRPQNALHFSPARTAETEMALVANIRPGHRIPPGRASPPRQGRGAFPPNRAGHACPFRSGGSHRMTTSAWCTIGPIVSRQPRAGASADEWTRWYWSDFLPAWSARTRDPAGPGYLDALDVNGRPLAPTRKSVLAQARLLFTFSHLALLSGNPGTWRRQEPRARPCPCSANHPACTAEPCPATASPARTSRTIWPPAMTRAS